MHNSRRHSIAYLHFVTLRPWPLTFWPIIISAVLVYRADTHTHTHTHLDTYSRITDAAKRFTPPTVVGVSKEVDSNVLYKLFFFDFAAFWRNKRLIDWLITMVIIVIAVTAFCAKQSCLCQNTTRYKIKYCLVSIWWNKNDIITNNRAPLLL